MVCACGHACVPVWPIALLLEVISIIWRLTDVEKQLQYAKFRRFFLHA